jgi:hypothetical protein
MLNNRSSVSLKDSRGEAATLPGKREPSRVLGGNQEKEKDSGSELFSKGEF